MAKKQFKSESKRLLDLMINSIYTNKEIFLRELISNASDAIDKFYYKSLTDEDIDFNKEDFYIKISKDKESRTLTISDKGIGMTEKELEENLGVIAKSGSLAFKDENEPVDGMDIIGQFGIGFYSAFMVADTITVISKTYGSEKAFKWESSGAEGYTIEETTKEDTGTDIILQIKENTDNDNYDKYLEEDTLRNLVKRYSDFIRYPIMMMVTKSRLKEGTEDEYEEYKEIETLNSMVPIWRKNKNELKEEDYENFYQEKHYGFDKPVKYIHFSMDGLISYRSLLFIPSQAPYDFYTKEFEKGLELYSSGVLIMDKCGELLPDYFSFVKGVVDSEDLSLNISREILQQDRQLQLIAKKVEEKIKDELKSLLLNDREKYEEFYESFGQQLKFGVYSDYGMNKDKLKDLLLFYSSKEESLVTLDEYVEKMPEDQDYIYYASGESINRIDKLPQTELVKDKGYEILYLTDDIDEFAIQMLVNYEEKEFKSVSSGDLGLDKDDESKDKEEDKKEYKELFTAMKDILAGKVKEVQVSHRLKNHPVCLTSEGDLSIEMEKILKTMPDNEEFQVDKVLEINTEHSIFNKLKDAFENDEEKLELYTKILYDQALLIEGLSIEDPVEFADNISKLM
ncbi:MAG TPA: molecular chaperone HtpG [Tissierellaceae bacterium]|nr:molecular chaperone HtpG [Tissierellaceae bacterium]